jgi:hypothetical protein
LLKVAAVVQTRVRRIWFHFATTWPYRGLSQRVQQALTRFVAEVRQALRAVPGGVVNEDSGLQLVDVSNPDGHEEQRACNVGQVGGGSGR